MINENEKKQIRSTLSFLEYLNQDEQDLIYSNTRIMKYNKGKYIGNQENNCLGIFIIKKGRIRIYILSDEGREVTLYRLEEEEVCVLSASCVIRNIAFDIHIEAEIDSEVYLINQSIMNQLSKNIYIENFLLKATADRFSDVMWTMEQILFYKFNKRLAIFLLDEIQRNANYSIKMTHDQIAKYLGSAREVVTKMLKYFTKEGLVELNRGEIKVINKEGLMRLI